MRWAALQPRWLQCCDWWSGQLEGGFTFLCNWLFSLWGIRACASLQWAGSSPHPYAKEFLLGSIFPIIPPACNFFFFFTFKHGFFPPKILLSIKLIKFLFLRAERLYSQPVFSERLLRMLPCGWKPPFRLFHSLGSQMKFIPLHALGRYLQTLFHMVYFLNCDRTFYEWQWKLHIWSEWKINLSWHQNFSWKISAFV